MPVCLCAIARKGYLHQELDESSLFLTTFNTELGRFRYSVMPFRGTVAGDVLAQSGPVFWHLKNVIVIADDTMTVGKTPSHSDHDKALTTLLEATRKCNVQLNYDKL